jgi:hypothetical protein
MHCGSCKSSSDGYAVHPGVGEAGEIRFYCDACARRSCVKMRYWDGRDLDVGGWRENPDLGASFQTLIFSFDDFARMRHEDVAAVVEWVDDRELAVALLGAPQRLLARVFGALRPDRSRRVRELLSSGKITDESKPLEAQARIVDTMRRL